MASQPTLTPIDDSRDAADLSTSHRAITQVRLASWRQLIPAHRLPVVAKTPMLVALGVYLAGGRFDAPAVWATLALSSALWAALYALNEATDLRHEQGYGVGLNAERALFALPPVLCLLATRLSPTLALYFVLMTAGQLAYCAPPLRLKRYWWAILFLSGTINPILRLQCGALWGTHGIAPLVYVTGIGLHVGSAIRARALLRDRDRKFGYRIAPLHIEWIGKVCTAVGFVGALWMCVQKMLPLVFMPMILLASGFAVYAWSGRETNVARLRQAWLVFAFLALIGFIALLLTSR